jgi:acyl-CoA thioesterase I
LRRHSRTGGPTPRIACEWLEARTFLSAVKIMPLGDSITEGSQGHASYRFWLWKKLELAGYQADFVGSRTGVYYSGGAPNQGPPLYADFDTQHEGHSGWRTDQVLAQIGSWTPTYQPDVVLLHLGTNDMLQSHTVTETITRLGQIIDTIRVSRPNVKFAMAKIIPSRVLNQNIQALNAQIPALAASKNTAQSPVVLVDQYAGYDAFTDNYDEYHPNARGENKMMNKWFAALTNLLPPPNPLPPPVTYLSDLNWTSMTNGFGPVERDRSNGESGPDDGGAINLNGVSTIKGLGAHAASEVIYSLGGQYARFRADVGVDDEVGNGGSVIFRVFVDGVNRYDSGLMTGSTATRSFNIDVTGGSTLRLLVTNGGDGDAFDHADWANARLIVAPRVVGSTYRFETAPHDLGFTFSGNVSSSFSTSDLLLENLTTSQAISPGSMALSYNTATNAATFTFPGLPGGLLPDGRYRATLLASGVSDSAGNPMLENHLYNFLFLTGDADNDGVVNLTDFNLLAANFGHPNRTFSQGDFNYDGIVSLQDFNLLAGRFGTTVMVAGVSDGPYAGGGNGAWNRIQDVVDERQD